MNVVCPSCGASNRQQARFCVVCRQPLSSAIQPAGALGATVAMPDPEPFYLADNHGQTYPLSGALMIIGREACDIAFPADSRISRQHACIEPTSTGWQISDIGSRNGTLLKGAKLVPHQPVPLQLNDWIVVGNTTLTLSSTLAPGYSPGPLDAPHMETSSQSWTPEPHPQIQWQSWKRPPQVEGRVIFVDATPHMEQKPVMGRALVAGVLALVMPVLAFLPFVSGNQVSVRNMRVEDRHSGQEIGIRIRGNMLGSINQGDIVAVWVSTQQGVLSMSQAYNYSTGQPVRVK